MRRALAILFALAVIVSPAARAVQPDEVMADPGKEARARNLSRELRCMVCQNQSIDDSEAPLARDLRLLVRERIAHHAPRLVQQFGKRWRPGKIQAKRHHVGDRANQRFELVF